MVCAEDVVSYFRSLKSYERIWIMCRLQHSCLPFELRFLGTCLEELGKKDFHELRQVENEANSAAEICLSELRKISNKHVQKKIILYLSLLHSHNYSCSNSLYKILCDSEEVNSFLKFETLDDEEDSFEHLLMIYTLAVNHPAFSCEQKQVLHNIFSIIQAEEIKRSSLKRSVTQASIGHTDNLPYSNAPIQLQECPPHISTSPENTYPPHQLPNPSHLRTVPPFTHELSIPMAEQISIGLPPPNFVRFPFPAAAWNPTIPIVFSTAEQTNTTQSFMSRSSSPSLSNSPSRSSSPSAKVRPLSAPFIRSPQMAGPVPHQPASLPLSQTNVDPFGEMINKDMSALPMNAVPNFASEQLYRLTDEELSTLGMTEESIQQLRCVVVDKRPCNDDITSTHSVSKTVQNADAEADPIAPAGLMYSTSMTVPANIMPNNASHQCPMCHSGQNNGQMNGFVSPGNVDIVSCIDHDLNMLHLESDAPSRNSNSSNSDATSSDQSSPPNTPALAENNYSKRNNKNNGSNEWSNNNVNINGGNNNDERSNTGDSSSEEKNSTIPTSYQGRGRIVNSSRGRSKNPNTYSRGRGNHRRRNENMNGNSEEMRKPQFSVGNTEGVPYQYTTNPVTAAVTNATYIPPHLIRSYTSFPVNSYSIRPHYPFPPSGELLYHQYPPPGAFLPGPIPYSMVPPKLSCYNCGSQNHFANDCSESTLEEATKQGQYRLDYTPVEGSFTEK